MRPSPSQTTPALPATIPPSRRTLIIGPSAVDEAVLAQPLIALLRRHEPFGLIDCLAPPETAPIFRLMGELDEVLECPVSDERLALAGRTRLARSLRRRRYDVAWTLPTARTAAIAPWLARIPAPQGRNRPLRRQQEGRPAERQPTGAGRSLARWFAALPWSTLGLAAPDPALAGPPRLTRTPALAPPTRQRLALADRQPLVLFGAGSEYGAGSQWPARHFVALANLVHETWPTARIAAIGRAQERHTGTHLRLISGGRIENWMGRLDLDETMALIARAEALVTNESSLLHLAAALGRPHVALFGAGDPRSEPAGDGRRHVMWLRQPCSPCLDSDCRFGHVDCLVRLSPQTVMGALRQTVEFAPRC